MIKRILLAAAVILQLSTSVTASNTERVSILGDSYSTFEGYVTPNNNRIWYFADADTTKTDVTSVNQTWWSILTSCEEYSLDTNNSFSGSTICNTGYDGVDATYSSFITRMYNLGSPSIILIFGATNDSWAGAPIGEFQYSNCTKEQLYAFRPAMAYLLSNAVQLYPDADIYFILNSELSSDIDESSIEICKQYNVKCIELKDIDKIHGHPSIKGMQQIAEQVKKGIE